MSITSGIATEPSKRAARNLLLRINKNAGAGPDDGSGVLENTFAPCGHRGEVVLLGKWPNEPDGAVEPIQWRVIGERADGARLIIALDALESRRAHDYDGDVTWQHSSLRYWLHKVFLPHAFTPDERDRVQPIKLTTFDNVEYKNIGCRGTVDRIFLLSEGEAAAFLPSNALRKASSSPYAKRLSSIPCWWLRSPGGHQFAFQCVNDKGDIDKNGLHSTLDCVGVRPALILRSSSGAATDDPVEFSFYGRHITEDAGYDLEYADEPAFLDDFSPNTLTPKQARVAVGGGYPSIAALNRLLDRNAFSVRDRHHLCQNAITAKESALAKRIIAQHLFDATQLTLLLNTCMSEGAIDLAEFLLANGASGAGYAKAYLPSARSEKVAICAVAVDPWGAMSLWESVRLHPLAVRKLIASVLAQRRAAHTLLRLPGLMVTCAKNGYLDELRLLVAKPAPELTQEMFTEAILEAKAADHPDIVAYLIDRQAALFPSQQASAIPSEEPSSSTPLTAESHTPSSRRPSLAL